MDYESMLAQIMRTGTWSGTPDHVPRADQHVCQADQPGTNAGT